MLDTVKTYLIEVVLKKALPGLLKGALLGLTGIVTAHQLLANKYGVSVQGENLVVNLQTLATMLASGVAGMSWDLIVHHVSAFLAQTPHSGAPVSNG